MKNSFMKKLLSSFLALAMVVTFAPANMGYAVNESKQAELRAWQKEVKKATDAEEEKAKAPKNNEAVGISVDKSVVLSLIAATVVLLSGKAFLDYKKESKSFTERVLGTGSYELPRGAKQVLATVGSVAGTIAGAGTFAVWAVPAMFIGCFFGRDMYNSKDEIKEVYEAVKGESKKAYGSFSGLLGRCYDGVSGWLGRRYDGVSGWVARRLQKVDKVEPVKTMLTPEATLAVDPGTTQSPMPTPEVTSTPTPIPTPESTP